MPDRRRFSDDTESNLQDRDTKSKNSYLSFFPMEAQSSVFLNFLILWMQILSPTIMETLVEVVVL